MPHPHDPDPRARLQHLIEHPRTQRTILALNIINAVVLGLETSAQVMAQAGPLLLALDKAILAVFGRWLAGKTGPIEGSIEKETGTVTGKGPARAVSAMCAGRQPDQ